MADVTVMTLNFDAENSLKWAKYCGEWFAKCERLTKERDTLRAELATVQAALPKWKRVDCPFDDLRQWGYALCYPQDVVVGYVTVGQGLWLGHREKHLADWTGGDFPTARKQIEEALGLPPCEVCE